MPIKTQSAESLRARFPKPQGDAKPPDLRGRVEAEPPKPEVIVLPYPPSYNRYWRNGSISEEGLRFKRQAAQALLQHRGEKVSGAVAVVLDFYRPRTIGDLDNRIKQVLDALQGKCYDNDSQIVEIDARRHEDKENPRVEIKVKAASGGLKYE